MAAKLIEPIADEVMTKAPSERCGQFVDRVRELDSDFAAFERVALWYAVAESEGADDQSGSPRQPAGNADT